MRPSSLRAALDWRARAVLARNLRVFLRTWATAFLPPAMEPVILFLTFGLGLGGYVGAIAYAGGDVAYASWVAPGLLAYTAFSTPFFEGLYSAFVRMFYQKTWDGILATQVEVEHVVWGEILWTGLRGTFSTAMVAIVLGGFHIAGFVHLQWPLLFVAPILAGLVGCVFGAFALVFTAIVPSIDHMNYPTFLVGIPLGLMSNTYFPVRAEHPFVAALVTVNPLAHLANTLRAMLLGGPVLRPLVSLAVCWAVYGLVLALVAERLVRRRVLGE